MEIREVADSAAFDQYVIQSNSCHYMKTTMYGEWRIKQDKENYNFNIRKYYKLGFYEGNELKGTALVLSGSWFGHHLLYIPKGPCIDYSNKELRVTVFQLLKKFADERHVEFLRVDPDVIRVHHDIKGNVIDDGFSNEEVTEDLKSLGFTHKGYGYAYNGSWLNRFTLIVDISKPMDQVKAGFSSRRKRTLKKAANFKLTTRIGTKDDIQTILDLQMQLVHQKGFTPSSYSYFSDMMACFGEHAVIYITEIDLKYAEEKARQDYEAKKNSGNERAAENAKETLELIQSYASKGFSIMPVAAGMFIRMGNYNWCWYYYFHKKFNRFSPLDSLHLYAMEDAKKHGVIYYDLCGFSGTSDPKDPEYHLYEYKHEFGPQFIEQIGEFDYVRSRQMWKLFKFEKLAFNHIKRKITSRYKKR